MATLRTFAATPSNPQRVSVNPAATRIRMAGGVRIALVHTANNSDVSLDGIGENGERSLIFRAPTCRNRLVETFEFYEYRTLLDGSLMDVVCCAPHEESAAGSDDGRAGELRICNKHFRVRNCAVGGYPVAFWHENVLNQESGRSVKCGGDDMLRHPLETSDIGEVQQRLSFTLR